MNYDFAKIQGPRQSKRENFEELISQLLAAEMDAQAVDGSGGDAGIDCFIKLDDGSLIIFQSKYFLTRLTNSQCKQIKHSLETAFQHHRLSRWILCIPINPTPKERGWFEALSRDDVSLEWWGETKIRTLIAKHPEIVRAFFMDDSLLSEFNAFRQEVIGTIRALKASRWADSLKDSPSVAYEYLERAAKIGNLLMQDAPLLQPQENIYIGLDFSELYTYMSSDARYVISTPVVDFCIQNSPQSLYLPPGTALELANFLRLARRHNFFNSDTHLDLLKLKDNPLQNFINAFERDNNSKAARHTYKLAVKYLQSINVPPSYNLSKLRSAFDSGLLKPAPHDMPDITIDEDDVIPIWSYLEKNRTNAPNRFAKLIDARNLLFLKKYMDMTDGMVRMISSDRLLARVSREVFGEASFVRNSSEYAYLVHSGRRRQLQSSSTSFESEVEELVRGTKALVQILKSTKRRTELISSDDKYLGSLLNTFQRFAPSYRMMLRPVDEMIESGLLALPSIYAQSMQELYAILKNESDLVASFKNWWDYMCQDLIAIHEILQKRYLTDKIIIESKLLEK